jgi:hypothetical protein
MDGTNGGILPSLKRNTSEPREKPSGGQSRRKADVEILQLAAGVSMMSAHPDGDKNDADQAMVSIFSAIASIFWTLFQFRPVPPTFRVLGIRAQDSVGRPMPFGK